jgi:tetratricopeptide (TPR) repeat protein
MPKTPSRHLFHLIKAMSSSEKRYFKLFIRTSSSSSENKYEQLFDAIDAQEEYDDEQLKQLIYGDKPIRSRKYSELKSYLFDQVLKSLQRYDDQRSVDFQLKNLLQSVRVAFQRSLFDICRQLLQKAKKVAQKHESFISILEILRWEKQIAYARMDVSYLDQHLDRIAEEEQSCLAQLRNLSEYQDIFFHLLISTKKEAFLRSKRKVAHLEKMMQHPLLGEVDQARSHRARILYYRIYSHFHYSCMDYRGYYETNRKLIELMEEKPFLLKEDVAEYISVLSNLTLSCGLLDKLDEVRDCLEKFHQITPITRDDELKIHRQYYASKFALCIATGEFEEGVRTLEAHEKASARFDSSLFEKSDFYFQYFYLYFGIGNYDQALTYLNEWLNLPRSVVRQDLQSMARILNLIIHFEMGNSILVEHLLRSAQRFLQKQNRFFEFEHLMLDFLKDTGKAHSGREVKEMTESLRQDLIRLSEVPEERVIFQYFDFLSWVDSKIENKPFAEVIRTKYLSRTSRQSEQK